MKHLFFILLFPLVACAAEVPKSPYIATVYPYADAMIKADRATHPLGQNDLRLLYTLSELSGRPNYKNAADAELRRLTRNPDEIANPRRAWMLWDRCFEIAPDDALAVASKSSSIRALAAAYQQTKNNDFLKRIEPTLTAGETPAQQLSIAIDSWGVASRLPEPLASKLRSFARSQDEAFLARPDPLKSERWQNSNGGPLTAGLAMLCVSRYENCGDVRYRKLIHAAADFYRDNPPPAGADISPMTFGHIISLELAAWRSAAKQEYLDAARSFADLAVKKCWEKGDPLPKVSQPADTLVIGLLELHLSILHITAVRCPANTIDR